MYNNLQVWEKKGERERERERERECAQTIFESKDEINVALLANGTNDSMYR